MITNRTISDVENAIRIRTEKVQTFQNLTEDDINTLERGSITINTLNRIERKQEELKDILNEHGYYTGNIVNKTWNYTQIFDVTDFERIISNTNKLRNAFYVYSKTPKTPDVSYYYEDINSLEKILVDIDEMIQQIDKTYIYCGTFECGEY